MIPTRVSPSVQAGYVLHDLTKDGSDPPVLGYITVLPHPHNEGELVYISFSCVDQSVLNHGTQAEAEEELTSRYEWFHGIGAHTREKHAEYLANILSETDGGCG